MGQDLSSFASVRGGRSFPFAGLSPAQISKMTLTIHQALEARPLLNDSLEPPDHPRGRLTISSLPCGLLAEATRLPFVCPGAAPCGQAWTWSLGPQMASL